MIYGFWQPIGTAEKDKERQARLLAAPPNRVIQGYWEELQGNWCDSISGWPILPAPTHWMPMPTHPDAQKDKNGSGNARIDYHDGSLDDASVPAVMLFRLERMNQTTYWMRLYRQGNSDIVIHLTAFPCRDGPILIGEHELQDD